MATTTGASPSKLPLPSLLPSALLKVPRSLGLLRTSAFAGHRLARPGLGQVLRTGYSSGWPAPEHWWPRAHFHLAWLASDAAGGWYLAWAEGETNVVTEISKFRPRLTRYDAQGQEIWTRSATIAPDIATAPESYYRTTGLAVLSDSVVFTLANPAAGGAYATRYGKDGTQLESVRDIEPVMLAAPAGPNSALLVGMERLYWATFPKP